MQAQFDPYRKWLGIPPEEQPPNYYRLLGLAVFEGDADVISHAADRQMAHVRTFQTGRYAALTQQLLNELSAARLCLLDKGKKTQYDAMLRGLGWGAATSAPPVIAPAAGLPPKSVNPRNPVAGPPVRRQPIPTAAPVNDPYDPLGLMSESISAPVQRTIVHRKQASSSTPMILVGVCLLVLIGAGVVIAINLNQDTPKTETAANPPVVTPPAPTKKTTEKDKDKDKDKDKAAAPEPNAKGAEKGSEKGGDKAAKPPEGAKAIDTGKKALDATGKTAEMGGAKKADGKTAETTAKTPAAPKRPEGEMPDFGPLPPLPSNDNPLELSALPIPTTASLRPILIELRPQWKEELLKAESREEKQSFVNSLLKKAGAARADLPRQYVLLKAAYDLAIEIADSESFLKATNQLSAAYAVDPWEMKARAFQKAGGAAQPEDILALLPECEKTIAAAVSANRFDAAANLTRAASALAKKGKSPDGSKKFDAMIGQLDQTSKDRDEAEKAQETLNRSRNDPQASQVVGSYACFVKGNWQQGIPYLKKADDIDLKQAAELDASNPFAAEKQADVADAWFNVAKKYDGLKRAEILKRAKFWYGRAVVGLMDKDKTDVEAKLKEIAEMLAKG